jgi:plastocyanin domain-containing protein
MLEPSDVRVTGFPNLVLVSADEYSESEASQSSGSIDSLLSLDLTSFTIFQNEVPDKTTLKEQVSEVTFESYKATIEMQFLIQTIQQLNSDMNH